MSLIISLSCFWVGFGCSDTSETVETAFGSDQTVPILADMQSSLVDGGVADMAQTEAFEPAAPHLKRLTNQQYRNAIADIFGLTLPTDMALATDTQLHGFRTIASAVLTISETEVENYEASAQWVANQLVAQRNEDESMIDCPIDEASCVEALLAAFGKTLWRREVTPDELTEHLTVWNDLQAQPFTDAERLELIIGALLQSPHFLYVVEIGEVDPSESGKRRRQSRELLTAATLLIWNAPPDQELLSTFDDDLYAPNQLNRLLAVSYTHLTLPTTPYV